MATESLVAALQGTDYDTGLDLKQLNVVRAYFAKLREKYIANGQISPKSLGVDANTLLYQVPGGMFSNMLKQLKDAGKEDKLDEVLAEIPAFVRTQAILRWSPPPARSLARRLCSTSSWASATRWSPRSSRAWSTAITARLLPYQPRVHQEDPGRRAAHHLPLCRHPGSRDGQAEG